MCTDSEFDLFLLARNGDNPPLYKYSKQKRHIKPVCTEPGTVIPVKID